jgi:hypothetical protein
MYIHPYTYSCIHTHMLEVYMYELVSRRGGRRRRRWGEEEEGLVGRGSE